MSASMRSTNATVSSASKVSSAEPNTSSPNPPETWGPQQNAVVNDQLDAAQSVQTSVAHQQHVTDVAAEILEASDESDDDSE
nr:MULTISPECIES: hypothetical protein [Haloplanus]